MTDDNDGCLILIILFFMALRGCNHAEENERKIDKLQPDGRRINFDNISQITGQIPHTLPGSTVKHHIAVG